MWWWFIGQDVLISLFEMALYSHNQVVSTSEGFPTWICWMLLKLHNFLPIRVLVLLARWDGCTLSKSFSILCFSVKSASVISARRIERIAAFIYRQACTSFRVYALYQCLHFILNTFLSSVSILSWMGEWLYQLLSSYTLLMELSGIPLILCLLHQHINYLANSPWL